MSRGEGLIFNEFSPHLGLTLGGRWRRELGRGARHRPLQKVFHGADLEAESMFTASCEGIAHHDGGGVRHSEGTSAGRRSQWELRRIRSGEKVDTTDFRPHPDSGDRIAAIWKTRLINSECDAQPVLYDRPREKPAVGRCRAGL